MLEAVSVRIGNPIKMPSGRIAYVSALKRYTVELLYEDDGAVVEMTRTALKRIIH